MAETNVTGMNPGKIIPSILMPLPDHDFDPTESAIPWKMCTSKGWKVAFSTEHGIVAQADQNRLKGPLPGLISAGAKVKAAYQEMTQDPSYQHPVTYVEIDPDQYKALLLPGGDGLRMRQYLESQLLQSKVLQFFQQSKLIGAICHGMLVLARTINPQTGRSVLYGYKVTAPPKSLDRFGYLLDSWFIKHGYIMYPSCVADEVRACLKHKDDFSRGPGILAPYVVSDHNLITSRWYLDAELFAVRFTDELQQQLHTGSMSA
jgi:putative intracellular protease/amidase